MPVECGFAELHLTEVGLTGKSGQVPEENQEQEVLKIISQLCGIAVKVQERETIKRDAFH